MSIRRPSGHTRVTRADFTQLRASTASDTASISVKRRFPGTAEATACDTSATLEPSTPPKR